MNYSKHNYYYNNIGVLLNKIEIIFYCIKECIQTMLSNRVHYYIRNMLQNSKLHRGNFVKNKKMYTNKNKNKNKNNHTFIVKRNYTFPHLPPPNNNNNNNNNIGFIVFASLSAYFHIYCNK